MGPEIRIARQHLVTITSHKIEVMRLMCKVGLGFQGLAHDLSKYAPAEFLTGVRYYQGTRSPNAAEREERGYSAAWLHHKGRNRHHYEYWIDIPGPDGQPAAGVAMPTRYVIEMLCDRIAASKVYQGAQYTDRSALEYFTRESLRCVGLMHPDTAAFLLVLLELIAEQGEDAALSYVRANVVEPRYVYAEGTRF